MIDHKPSRPLKTRFNTLTGRSTPELLIWDLHPMRFDSLQEEPAYTSWTRTVPVTPCKTAVQYNQIDSTFKLHGV